MHAVTRQWERPTLLRTQSESKALPLHALKCLSRIKTATCQNVCIFVTQFPFFSKLYALHFTALGRFVLSVLRNIDWFLKNKKQTKKTHLTSKYLSQWLLERFKIAILQLNFFKTCLSVWNNNRMNPKIVIWGISGEETKKILLAREIQFEQRIILLFDVLKSRRLPLV